MHNFGFGFIPENEFYAELEQLINTYSKKFSTPSFLPHVTIYRDEINSKKAIVAKVNTAAKQIQPFKIEIGDVEFSTTLHQCVFARMKTSAQIMNAHLMMKKVFHNNDSHAFMPHASIVYGDLSMETREKISQEVHLHSKSFMAKKITIFLCDSNKPEEWGIEEQIELKKCSYAHYLY